MTIKLTRAHYREILSHSLSSYPLEACGLLAGTRGEDYICIKKIYPLTNLDCSPEHFTLDPLEQFAVIKDVRSNSWQLVGNFHSHPATPARPSEEDKRLALDRELSYLILSLADKTHPILKSFCFGGEHLQEEELLIEERTEPDQNSLYTRC